MKKILSVLLAVICAFSVCVIGFADDAQYDPHQESGTAAYKCSYCSAEFDNAASLADHAAATFPVDGHMTKCSNHCDKDFDGAEDYCTFETMYVAEMERHQAVCEYKGSSNWDMTKGYFKAGDILNGLKYLVKAIIDFVKSDTFKGILDKVVGVVKGIDLSGVIGTVKGVIGKIPFGDIVAKIQGLVG